MQVYDFGLWHVFITLTGRTTVHFQINWLQRRSCQTSAWRKQEKPNPAGEGGPLKASAAEAIF